MFKDSAIVKARHDRFVKKICETETVIGLKNNQGYATSSSVHYEDGNEEPIGLICFWAEKAYAKSCIKGNWSDYCISEIPLSEFMENWCVGMFKDGLLVGTEFDHKMFGFEIEPLDLALELINELKNLNKELVFKKFTGLDDFNKQIESTI